MYDLYDDIHNEYIKETDRILALNKKYIEEQKIPTKEFKYTKMFQRVIPKFESLPFFRYYVYSKFNITGTDDAVLRFVPYIETNEKYTKILNYDDTLLTEEPFTKEEAIKTKFLKEHIFNKFDNLELFNLKTNYDKNNITALRKNREFIAIESVSQMLKMPTKKILEKWLAEFDRRPVSLYNDDNAFNSYFCNICIMFGCTRHVEIGKNMYRIENKKFDQKKKCSPNCYKITKDNFDFTPKDRNFFSKNILKSYKKIIKHFELTPCQLVKFINFFCNVEITCRYTSKIMELFSLHQIKYKKKQPGKPAPDDFISKSEQFYQQCNHSGSCYKNKDCCCFVNKTFCEETCFCECCDLLFTNCKCRVCNKNCVCVKNSRECSHFCKCTKCRNLNISKINEKSTYIAASLIEGYGVFAATNIQKGDYVMEYTGEIISNEEAERRGHFYEKRALSYLFDLSFRHTITQETIDATKIGNKARFINHSQNANIVARTVQVNGIKRIGFYALKNIEKDEELFFDYKYKEEQKIKYHIIEK